MDYQNISFSQRTMSEISGISVSSINRYVTQHNIDSLQINSKIRRYPLAICRKILHDMKFQELVPNRKIQVFFNFKGGTGKTSLCFQISSHLAFLGYKVLAIDCDAQGHLSSCFHQLDTNNQGHTIYDVLKGHVQMSQAIKSVFEGLDLIPANLSLTHAEVGLGAAHNREKLLSKQLESIKGSYDFIFIDTNPTFSILNFNALLAADDVNIICETQPMSYSGLKILMAPNVAVEIQMLPDLSSYREYIFLSFGKASHLTAVKVFPLYLVRFPFSCPIQIFPLLSNNNALTLLSANPFSVV